MSLMTLLFIKVPQQYTEDGGGSWSNIFDGIIRADTYKITPNIRQDLDSFRDADGTLHRTALDVACTTIDFSLIPMHKWQMEQRMKSIFKWAEKPEMKYEIKYYNPLKGGYDTGTFYLGANHPTWQIYGNYNDDIIYRETEFKFIEYGKKFYA